MDWLDDRLVTSAPGRRPSTYSAASARVQSSPTGSPEPDTSASRSPSGSTAMPISAPAERTSRESSPRFAGIGSGSRGNRPSVASPTPSTLHPSRRSSSGTTAPPAPCTQSSATTGARPRIASTSSRGSDRTRSMWCSATPSSVPPLPRPLQSASSGPCSNSRWTARPSPGLTNIPEPEASFRPFHSMGLCDAVRTRPPTARTSSRTARRMVGVGAIPASRTATPAARRPAEAACESREPEVLESRPTIT